MAGDDHLEREYGIRIPVVEIDGRERFEYQVDPAELLAIVRGLRLSDAFAAACELENGGSVG